MPDDTKGLPLGLQTVGNPGAEDAVLHLAYQYQNAASWSTNHPASNQNEV
jgi:Asp-tRNA(Asn)/Glu-tRNA(Gln) amidotransferase A subunit family amidase